MGCEIGCTGDYFMMEMRATTSAAIANTPKEYLIKHVLMNSMS
jgi:hypothetical protein